MMSVGRLAIVLVTTTAATPTSSNVNVVRASACDSASICCDAMAALS